jgi:ring-1,2-phenylacetyl-CoA epoxidase subunit PaaE
MTSGKAEMAINYALEPREVEQGFILTCQARPVGEGPFVVDYDQQ